MENNDLLEMVRSKAQGWLTKSYDAETRAQVQALLDNEDPTELIECFYKGTYVADAKTARQSLTRNLKILFDQVVTELFVLETPVEELRTRMDDAKEQLSMEDDLVRFVTQDMQTEDVVTEGNDDTDK